MDKARLKQVLLSSTMLVGTLVSTYVAHAKSCYNGDGGANFTCADNACCNQVMTQYGVCWNQNGSCCGTGCGPV